MSRDWREYLADVVNHCEFAVELAEQYDPEAMRTNTVARMALERILEIVGEAANRLPEEVRARYPEIPWRSMIGARHKIAHGYFNLDHNLLWRTAKEVIPQSLPRLREILLIERAGS